MADENAVQITINAVDKSAEVINKAVDRIKGFGDVMGRIGTAATVVFGVMDAAILAAGKSMINTMDEMGKSAQKAGIATETFSTLSAAAKIFGVSSDDLQKGIRKLSGEMVLLREAGDKPTGALHDLGVAATDANGRLLPTQAVLLAVADKFSKMEDGANKTKYAVDLFGRAGEQMIPMLNKGRDGVSELQEKLKDMGLEISGSTARAAEQFNEGMELLHLKVAGFVQLVVADMLPSMIALADVFTKNDKAASGAGEQVDALGVKAEKSANALKGMAVVAYGLWTAFKEIGEVISGVVVANLIMLEAEVTLVIETVKGLWNALVVLKDGFLDLIGVMGEFGAVAQKVIKGDMQGAWDSAKRATEDFRASAEHTLNGFTDSVTGSWDKIPAIVADSTAKMKTLWHAVATDLTSEADKLAKVYSAIFYPPAAPAPRATPLGQGPARGGGNEEAIAKTMQQMEALAAMQRQMDVEGLTGIGQIITKLDDEYAKRAALIAKNSNDEEQSIRLLGEAWAAHERKKSQVFQQEEDKRKTVEERLTAAGMDAWSQRDYVVKTSLEQEIREIDKMAADYDQKMALILAATQRTKQAELQIFATNAQAVAGVLGTMAGIAQQVGKKGFIAYKAIASAQAAISTASGVARALTDFPWPWSIAVGAIVAAAGAAQIAMIASSNPIGQAHDGMDYVPRTGTYILERGEAVIKKSQNEKLMQGMGGASEVNIYLDGQVLGRGLGQMSRDGRLSIYARAIV